VSAAATVGIWRLQLLLRPATLGALRRLRRAAPHGLQRLFLLLRPTALGGWLLLPLRPTVLSGCLLPRLWPGAVSSTTIYFTTLSAGPELPNAHRPPVRSVNEIMSTASASGD
jgi:hypothetical protein